MHRKLLAICLLAFLSLPSASSQTRERPTAVFAGIVLLEDGNPVSEPVEVFLICSGSVRQQVYTQPGGQFHFQWGDNTAAGTEMHETAGSPSGGGYARFNRFGRGFDHSGEYGTGRALFGRINLNDCEIMAALPGFSSDIIQLGVHGVLDNPDVGSIVLRKIAQATGTTVSLKSLKAPQKAAKAYAKAKKELNKKKANYSKAVKELKKATDEYAEFAAAWYLLGVCRSVLRDQAGALEAFEKSAAADPDYLLPSLGIAELRLQQDRFQEASDLVSQVLERNPEVMRASYIQAFANYSLGNVDVAERSIRRVQDSEEARSYPGTHYLLGMILATKKDFRSAAAEFRRFLELTPLFANAQELKQQLLDWEAQGLIEGALP